MQGKIIVAALGIALLASPAWAQALTQAAPGQTTLVPVPLHPLNRVPSPRKDSAAPVPSTRVLGVPVAADAPVSPSYDGTAFKTLGGQAETGQDAIDGQVMQPANGAAPKP